MKKIDNKEYEKIVHDNAKDLIMKNGIKGWNMDELASLSGVAKKTLYGIIGSKEKLILELFEKETEKSHNAMVALVSGTESSRIKLEKLMFEMPIRLGGFTRKFAREMRTEFPLVQKKLKAKHEVQLKLVADFLKSCKSEGILKKEIDIEVLLYLFKTIIESMVLSDYSEEKYALYSRKSMEYILRGVIKK